MERETHLEMSPRRTGKSTRLAEAAAQHILSGGEAFILCGSYNFDAIIRRIALELGENFNGFQDKIFQVHTPKDFSRSSEKFRGTIVTDPRLFCDDADTPLFQIPIIRGSYYTSSSTYRGSKQILSQLTDGQYISYHISQEEEKESETYVFSSWPTHDSHIVIKRPQ